MGLLDGFPYCRIGEFIRFSISSTKAVTLPSCATSATLDLEVRDSIVVLLLNFGSILQQKRVSHRRICITIKKKNKKIY